MFLSSKVIGAPPQARLATSCEQCIDQLIIVVLGVSKRASFHFVCTNKEVPAPTVQN